MNIAIKQNKKGTFLDLSKVDLGSTEFINDLESFTHESSEFLSGSSVSLILPQDLDINQIGGDSRAIIDEVKSKLNQNNISIKSISNGQEETSTKAKPEQLTTKEEANKETSEKEIVDTSTLPETLYVEANLRSGQLIRYPGNVFVLGDVNPSAEIIAAGDVVVWGKLRGIVHAGAYGDEEAKIVAMKIDAGQLRIADRLIEVSKAQSKKSPLELLTGSKREGGMQPELVKIENNEIIIRSYF